MRKIGKLIMLFVMLIYFEDRFSKLSSQKYAVVKEIEWMSTFPCKVIHNGPDDI